MTHPLKHLLSSFLKNSESWKVQLLQNWPTIIGPLQNKVKLEKIQETTLVLSVKDACWLQELYLLSPILLKTINEKLDQPRIKRLRFKQAIEKKKKGKQVVAKKPKKRKNVIISAREKKALEAIDDHQLRMALEGFLIRCYQEKE